MITLLAMFSGTLIKGKFNFIDKILSELKYESHTIDHFNLRVITMDITSYNICACYLNIL